VSVTTLALQGILTQQFIKCVSKAEIESVIVVKILRRQQLSDPPEKSMAGENGLSLVSRRQALAMLMSATALGNASFTVGAQEAASVSAKPVPREKPYLSLVSRHLQWTDAENGIAVAKEAGFPAILWTVRRGAHIEPEQVETELPRIVRLTKAAGIDTPMIITAIGDVTSDRAEAILATMKGLGIHLYRAVTPRYNYNAPVQPQLAACKGKIAGLAKLNEKYDTTAAFHTHSYADTIGGSAWDLLMLINDLDPRYVGLNYDIGHVTAKGGFGWRESVRAAGPYLHSVSIKDFYWEKEPRVPSGEWPWRTRFVKPGDGMVDFSDFFRYLQSIGFQGPLENYFEYTVDVPGLSKPFDMLGTDYKKWKLEMPQLTFVGYLKRDVNFYNAVWQQAMATPPPQSFSVKAGEDS
jgi:sugar phosphate isomerase/epimerase